MFEATADKYDTEGPLQTGAGGEENPLVEPEATSARTAPKDGISRLGDMFSRLLGN